jgi:tetratricopeptide (TPR) repeat protein
MGYPKNSGNTRQNMLILLLLPAFFTVFSCSFLHDNLGGGSGGIDPYYITGSKEQRGQFLELFNLLKLEEPGSEDEFAVLREIARQYTLLKDYERLIHFLSDRTINNPNDPYNGYYLLMITYAYLQLDSEPIASLYFDLIIMNYPDLVINDESIHLVCLRHLINHNDDPDRQVWYYQELISRFSDKIDLGMAYFMLGQAYERVGDWNSAIAAYTNYLPYTGTSIPGFPNADQYARQQVDFSRSPKDWTFESLAALRAAIEEALDEGNPRALQRCQAKVNFFTRSWEQMEIETMRSARMVNFSFATFMYNNHIRYAPSLDVSSNATEAYLRTTGWSPSIPIWYLYFRKINFPQDPEIHGRWEWAGIFYGEKI